MKDRSDNLGVDDDAENDNDTQKRPFFFIFFSFCFFSSTFGPVITVLSGTGQQNIPLILH